MLSAVLVLIQNTYSYFIENPHILAGACAIGELGYVIPEKVVLSQEGVTNLPVSTAGSSFGTILSSEETRIKKASMLTGHAALLIGIVFISGLALCYAGVIPNSILEEVVPSDFDFSKHLDIPEDYIPE